jgi:LmbE family N-acetylglucosaminyl deacetylase
MNSPSLLQSFARTLVLAPHTDDEFGCAGTIARLVELERDVHYIAFSRCEESVPAGYPQDVLEHECRECLARLGVPPDRVEVLGFPVRHFPSHRQNILERLVLIQRSMKPDLVLVPSSFDIHQDHATIHTEAMRAFKHSSILGYELPQNLTAFENSAFVALSAEHVSAKVHSLSAYKSQRHRPYATEEFMRSLALVRGMQAGVGYAEAFELARLVIR